MSIEWSLVVRDEEGAGVINVAKEVSGDRFFILSSGVFLIMNGFKEGTINYGIVVEVGGNFDDVAVHEMGVHGGWACGRGEIATEGEQVPWWEWMACYGSRAAARRARGVPHSHKVQCTHTEVCTYVRN